MRKVALITGVTGQDGAYLAEFLLKKGYHVHGVKRRSSSLNTARIDHIYEDPLERKTNFFLHYGDMTDATNLIRLIQKIKPDEIYNLAAQSHVLVSFETPEYTANADALGTLRILEAIRILGLEKKVKFYWHQPLNYMVIQKKSIKMKKHHFYQEVPMLLRSFMLIGLQSITVKLTIYLPVMEYYLIMKVRIRGETFVTKKIVKSAVKISKGLQDCLYLGNLNASRDWGHARDYVEGMWMILATKKTRGFCFCNWENLHSKIFRRKSLFSIRYKNFMER